MNRQWDAQSRPGFVSPRLDDPNIRVPAQVSVAFDILKWANSIETGQGGRNFDDPRLEGRELRLTEKAVYEASLEILRLYLTGEMLFAGTADGSDESAELRTEMSAFCKSEKLS